MELAQITTTNSEQVVVVTKLKFCDVASADLLRTARRPIPVTLSGATRSVGRVFDLLDALQVQTLPRCRPVSHPLAQPHSRPLTRRACPCDSS